MNCHALKKSGEVCGARAFEVVSGHPACGRHDRESGEFAPATDERLRIVVEFMGGGSMEAVARKHGLSPGEVEETIREMRR
jgi:hypothetical protein